jgi:hypothetical protein
VSSEFETKLILNLRRSVIITIQQNTIIIHGISNQNEEKKKRERWSSYANTKMLRWYLHSNITRSQTT